MACEKDFQITIRISREMRKKIGRYLSSLDEEVLSRNDFINILLDDFFKHAAKPLRPLSDPIQEFLHDFKQ